MKVRAGHMVCALMLGLLLASCSGRPRIIPRATLTDIYVDMFLADQWIKDHSSERSRADTSLFYDPILARYGYTFEDYDATVKRYLDDPEKFSKVFRDASAKLKKKVEHYDRIVNKQRKVKEFNDYFLDKYTTVDFKSDTLLWERHLPDTIVLDSLTLDSLRRDSLFRDSVARETFRIDSLRRDSLRRDSLFRERKRLDSALTRQRSRHSSKRLPTINQ
ncbi:MAG: DUF4296 domain-containing protein [Bacteroidales bacterium]|nr:DUF4296 domain-containing protein [Bacteroidales bacterium]